MFDTAMRALICAARPFVGGLPSPEHDEPSVEQVLAPNPSRLSVLRNWISQGCLAVARKLVPQHVPIESAAGMPDAYKGLTGPMHADRMAKLRGRHCAEQLSFVDRCNEYLLRPTNKALEELLSKHIDKADTRGSVSASV
jgi:hypothetical protein